MELAQINLKDKYRQLSSGKQRQLRQLYCQNIGSKSSFYDKINGTIALRKAEIHFFNKHLLTC